MRFRAKMHNTANILQLTSKFCADFIVHCVISYNCVSNPLFNATAEVVTTISRSARQCVLRLSEDKLSFASLESGVLGGVNLWCELSQVSPLHFIELQTRAVHTDTCVRIHAHCYACIYVASRIFYPPLALPRVISPSGPCIVHHSVQTLCFVE